MTMRPLIHFAHANGVPSPVYRRLFEQLESDFDVVVIEDIGTHADYPVTDQWRQLVDQLIASVEHQNGSAQGQKRQVIGLGHSLGGLLTFMAAYRRPDLFSQVIAMEPPLINGPDALAIHLSKRFAPGWLDKTTPAGLSLKRRDHWASREEAAELLGSRGFLAEFERGCFEDYIQHALVEAPQGGVTLRIPKMTEVTIFRSLPSWFWLKPRKAPKVPVTLIAGKDSLFLKRRYPQRLQKKLGIPYQVFEGGHMFPLEKPADTAILLRELIQAA